MSHIHLIGIELEGGWYSDRSPRNPIHDRSVQFTEPDPKLSFIGETASPALGFAQVKPWIDENYPNKINETCGVHIHVSVKSDSDYIRLMSEDFEIFFHQRMKEFGEKMGYSKDHPFWPRLKGSNPYCARDFKPEKQAIRTDKRGPRYSQLNYCFSLHGTLECRLFHGSNNPEEIYSCVLAFINIVEDFLEQPQIKNKEFDKVYEIWENELLSIDTTEEMIEPSLGLNSGSRQRYSYGDEWSMPTLQYTTSGRTS